MHKRRGWERQARLFLLEQSATEKFYFKSPLYMRSCSNSKTNIVKDTHCYDKAAHDQIQTSSECLRMLSGHVGCNSFVWFFEN